MSLMKYEPFDFINRIQEDLNEFFTSGRMDRFPGLAESSELMTGEWNPRVDLKESDENFLVKAERKHGVLEIKIAKKPAAKPRLVEVNS